MDLRHCAMLHVKRRKEPVIQGRTPLIPDPYSSASRAACGHTAGPAASRTCVRSPGKSCVPPARVAAGGKESCSPGTEPPLSEPNLNVLPAAYGHTAIGAAASRRS